MTRKAENQFAAMSKHEKRLKIHGYQNIAGVDEAGRGPLAGPVYAAACILPCGVVFKGLNDSKQLTESQRESIYEKLMLTEGVIFGLGIATREEIDQINIFQATMLAMRRAIEALHIQPDYILIDGNKAPNLQIPSQTIVKGDCVSISIAAASIIAKVNRDHYMLELDQQWPQYGFAKHKGYYTEQHLKAIDQWGPCSEHRMSFQPLSKQNRNDNTGIRGD